MGSEMCIRDRVKEGNLIIQAHNDQPNVVGTSRPYSSARIRTKHRGDWKYCRIDVRAKLPAGKGIWPAIWMLPTDEKYGGWASSGEIDIMELVGNEPSTYHGTCLLYTSDAADDMQCVDLGGRRIIK